MIYSGFLLGLVGSLHCAAMCGPLMLGLSSQKYSLSNLLVHHAGRWIGYIFLAMLFRAIVSPLYVFQIQQYVGIVSGILLIIFGLKSYLPPVDKFFSRVSAKIAGLMNLSSNGKRGNIVLGVLNGLLPCGLSFGTAILSVNLPSAGEAAIYMVFFGVGTLPILLGISYFPKLSFFQNMRRKWSFTANKVVVVLGLVILLRSAQLGIPFVSPTFNSGEQQVECCEAK